MKLYDVKAKMHGESYDAVSELSLDADGVFEAFADDYGWERSILVSDMTASGEVEAARVILHSEITAPDGNSMTVDFVRYENNRLGIDNKVVIRAATPRGELASSVLRGLKLMKMPQSSRLALLRSELERLADFMEHT